MCIRDSPRCGPIPALFPAAAPLAQVAAHAPFRPGAGTAPVSYTHLDVYKRQELLRQVPIQEVQRGPDPFPEPRRNSALPAQIFFQELSNKEILDAIGELDFEPEQLEKFYDTLEAMIPRVISVCKFIAVQFQMLPSNQMIDSDYAPFQLAPKAFN